MKIFVKLTSIKKTLNFQVFFMLFHRKVFAFECNAGVNPHYMEEHENNFLKVQF